jgi:hypothetical protein
MKFKIQCLLSYHRGSDVIQNHDSENFMQNLLYHLRIYANIDQNRSNIVELGFDVTHKRSECLARKTTCRRGGG